ncbi:MAG: hypothetical protein QE487_16065 [Fluviicola sp.]|nr:hypothetical protein [Fluviicola sp.]
MKNLYIAFFAFSSIISSLNAQSELTVNCYPENTIYNSVSLNNDIVEYGLCSTEPAFYLSVFDPSTCLPWKTNYQGSNPMNEFGNFNTNGACRPRDEAYFIFQYSDSTQLAGMNDMINQIPNGFPYVIYTPISYDYTTVNGNSSALIQTLISKWNSGIVEGNQIMVLFGIQGQPSSFAEDTLVDIDHISFTTTICDVTGLDNQLLTNTSVAYIGNDQFELIGNSDVVSLYSITGEEIALIKTGNIFTAQSGLSKGVYFIRGTLSGKNWSQKVVVY